VRDRYGATLILGSVVLVATAVIHPSVVPFGDQAALARMTLIDGLAHGLAVLGTWLVLVGLVGLSRMLGLERITVLAALLAFALPAAGVVVAAALDGFVLPQLAQQWTGADQVVRDELRVLIRFCVLVASAITRIYLLFGAVAIVLWSWVIYRDRLSRTLPWLGALLGLAGIATLIGGPPYINVHELLALVFGQAVWLVLAGLMMIRRNVAS
jgi:hypothetical protein